MFLFQFVMHIIETVIVIYEILMIWWVDPQYPWSQGIGSPIWGSSMTRVREDSFNENSPHHPFKYLTTYISFQRYILKDP